MTDQRHELDRRRRLRRAAGERAPAARDGLEFLASYTYGKALSDNVGYYGVGWGQTAGRATTTSTATDPLSDYGPSAVRHAAHLQPGRHLRAAVRERAQVRAVLESCDERCRLAAGA